MDYTILILLGLIGILSIPILGYIIYRNIMKLVQKFIENPLNSFQDKDIEDFSQKLINNEKFQRFLFEAGALIGNGAKGGLGLDKMMGGGKKQGGMLGTLMQLYQMYKGGLGGIVQNQPEQQSSNTSLSP